MTDAVKTITTSSETAFRPLIAKTLVVLLAVAMAPWFSGGQAPVGMLLSAFALLVGAVLVWLQPAAPQFKKGPLMAAYAALMGLAVLSLLWTANQYSTALWIAQWSLAGLAFRLSYSISGDEVGKKWLIAAYAVSAGVFSAWAVGMYLMSEYGRLTGTFYWANPAAAYLIPAIVLGTDRLRRASGRRQWGWLGYVAFTTAAFLLADSRAASLVLVICLIFYLLLVKLSWRFWILFVFSMVLAYGLSLGLAALSTITVQHSGKILPGSRFSEALKGESSSGSDRWFYLKSAGMMVRDHPWGVGAGAYGDVHPRYQERVVSASTSAHNTYVQTVAELGIAGGILLLALLAILGFGAVRGLVSQPELLPLAIGALGILIHMGLDIDARYPALLMLVGAFFGLLYAPKMFKWVKQPVWWLIVAILALVPVVAIYMSETRGEWGRTTQADEDYEVAAENFAMANAIIWANPDYLTAEGINRFSLAELGGKQKAANMDAALDLARQAERADPYDGQHWLLEGRVLRLKGDQKGAGAALRQALKLDPYNHPEYASDLAAVLVLQHRQPEALAVASAMLAQYPADVLAHRTADETLRPRLADLEALVGNVHLEAGRLAEARAAADRALALDAKSLKARALKRQVEIATSKPL